MVLGRHMTRQNVSLNIFYNQPSLPKVSLQRGRTKYLPHCKSNRSVGIVDNSVSLHNFELNFLSNRNQNVFRKCSFLLSKLDSNSCFSPDQDVQHK